MDLDLLGLFWKGITHFKAELHNTDLHICGNFGRINRCYNQISMFISLQTMYMYSDNFIMKKQSAINTNHCVLKIAYFVIIIFFYIGDQVEYCTNCMKSKYREKTASQTTIILDTLQMYVKHVTCKPGILRSACAHMQS